MGNHNRPQRPDASNHDAVMFKKGTHVEIRPQAVIRDNSPVDAIDINSRTVRLCFGNRVPGIDVMRSALEAQTDKDILIGDGKGRISFTVNNRADYDAVLDAAKNAGIRIPGGMTGIAQSNLPSCWPVADRPGAGAAVGAA